MLHIFQVGNVVIDVYEQQWHGLRTTVADDKAVAVTNSPYFLWPSSEYRLKPTSVEIEGEVLSDGRTYNQKVNLLRRMKGIPVEIIAWEVLDCCHEGGCGCHTSSYAPIIWYSNYGVLTSVEETSSHRKFPTVSLSLVVGAFWQPINRYYWSWQTEDPDYFSGVGLRPAASHIYTPSLSTTYTPINYGSYMHQYPGAFEIHQKWGWKRVLNDEITYYDPNLWEKFLSNLTDNFPLASARSWDTAFSYDVDVDESLWNAPPLSLYAVSNLPTTGELTITVERLNSQNMKVTEVTTVDLGQLYFDLYFASAYYRTNTLIIGDLRRKPGFVVMDDEVGGSPTIVSDIYPYTTFPGLWPGMLSPGRNRVTITVDPPDYSGDPVYLSCFHLFRKM